MKSPGIVILLLLLAPFTVFRAETVEQDSAKVTLPDSTLIADTLALFDDTLTVAQRTLLEFEELYLQNQLKQASKSVRRFSFHDSLAQYFLLRRLNESDQIKRGMFGDAGDYFKSRPAFFGLDYQETPMRQTVQPFGLSGERLNLINNGFVMQPFEHMPEPDGLVDLNDIPTALDEDIYILPGAAGALFGGDNVIASLVTLSKRPETLTPISALIVDKGAFGYSYARGRYSKRFQDGREIDLSVGYRNGDGGGFVVGDDSYNLYSNLYVPLKQYSGIAATVSIYDRNGFLGSRPDINLVTVHRDHTEQSIRLAWYRNNSDGDTRQDVGYSYTSQESKLGSPYSGQFVNTSHGGFYTREWTDGQFVLKAEAAGTFSKYEDGNRRFERLWQSSSFTIAQLRESGRFAFRLSEKWVERYGFLPSASALFVSEGKKSFMSFSAGYATKAPELHLLHARTLTLNLYGVTDDYTELSNPNLTSERQLVGSAEFGLGSSDNNIGLSITGGRIFDGIDWNNLTVNGVTTFSPINGDVNFVSVSANSRLRLEDFFYLTGGGAYNYVDYEMIPDRAYTPEYHFFTGGELHVYWQQKLVHLYAYGEVIYNGPYHGYTGRTLGNQAVANAKLSIRMGKFRFHYVFRNILQQIYEPREYFATVGRYTSYGFVWDFLD